MTVAAVIQRAQAGFTPYGGAALFMYCHEPEVIIGGPYDTGKTITALNRLHLLLCKHAGARALMVRKTYQSLIQTAVVTYERKVLPAPPDTPGCPVDRMGGTRPDWYDYPNGSRLVTGGLDNPGKTLSSEYDFIYVNQAEELTEDEWQALTRAASGRAGHAPYSQVMGDCNPDVPDHWIKTRRRVTFIESRHEENPTIFDQVTGELIAPDRMAALDAMTGVRYKRGRLGLWVGRAGQVYEFDPAIHLIDGAAVPPLVRHYRVIDFGYSNPFVCQLWGEDSDGRIYLLREIYQSQQTVNQLAPQITAMSASHAVTATIADHDAEDRATLGEHGIKTLPADKRIKTGLDAVTERLKVAGDGKPRLYIVRDATIGQDTRLAELRRPVSTEKEFPGYVWPDTKAGRAADEMPVKSDDHGCFVAGTLVTTSRGDVPIEHVAIGDMVLTRFGYRPVIASGMTEESAQTVTAIFSNGKTLTGTPNHPVWSRGAGFIRIDELRYMDIIETPSKWQRVYPCLLNAKRARRWLWSIKALSSGDTRSQKAGRIECITCPNMPLASRALTDCIERFGKTITVGYQRGTRYITETATRSITIPAILNASYQSNTTITTKSNILRHRETAAGSGSLKRLDPKLIVGIVAPPAAHGIASTARTLGRNARSTPLTACNAAQHSRQSSQITRDFAQTSAGHARDTKAVSITRIVFASAVKSLSRLISIRKKNSAPVRVVRVIGGRKRPVYNLTVDAPVGEYFANGVLVHNCDALRYMVMYLDGGGGIPTAGVSSYAQRNFSTPQRPRR